MYRFISSPVGSAHFTFGNKAWWHIRDHFVPHSRNNYQPHLLHHRTLTALSTLLIAAKIFGLSVVAFSDQPVIVHASEITQNAVLELTNKARAGEGLGSLEYNATLERAAQAKADDMAARKYFSHTTPDGKTPWTFFEAAGYAYQSAGENLAVHFADVEPLQDAWMNSPGHRANIMSPKYTEMGVGIARGVYEGYESVFVVELFGLPAAQQAVAQAPQAPVPTTAPAPQPASARAAFAPRTARAAGVESTAPEAGVPAVPHAALEPAAGGVMVRVAAAPDTVKALLVYGSRSVMLTPKADGYWQASVSVEALQGNAPVVQLYTMRGPSGVLSLGAVTPTFSERYEQTRSSTQAATVGVFGHAIPLAGVEQKVYIAVIALLLTALIIALAVHVHMRHIHLIANASFVVFFAVLLLTL